MEIIKLPLPIPIPKNYRYRYCSEIALELRELQLLTPIPMRSHLPPLLAYSVSLLEFPWDFVHNAPPEILCRMHVKYWNFPGKLCTLHQKYWNFPGIFCIMHLKAGLHLCTLHQNATLVAEKFHEQMPQKPNGGKVVQTEKREWWPLRSCRNRRSTQAGSTTSNT